MIIIIPVRPRLVTITTFDSVLGTSVSFRNDDTHDNAILNIYQDQPINITCIAEDALPPSQLTVTINGARIDTIDRVVTDGDLFDTSTQWVGSIPTHAQGNDTQVQCTARGDAYSDGITARFTINAVGKWKWQIPLHLVTFLSKNMIWQKLPFWG